MAEAGDGSGHTPLTPEWTPAPRASHYPWQGDRPAAAPSIVRSRLWHSVASVCLSPCLCTECTCIVAERCILEQKLLLTAYMKKSIVTKTKSMISTFV